MKHIFKICMLIMLVSSQIIAQTGVWIKAGLEKKITDKLDLEINVQPRYKDINEKPSSWVAEVGVKYDLVKNLNLAVFYRHISDLKKSGYKPYHRFYADLSYKFKKLNPIIIEYRLRYQQQFQDVDNDLITDKNYWRNKLDLSYKNKTKFEPYVSADAFYKVGYAFDQIRYKAGVDISITKKQKIDLGYQIDDELNNTDESQKRVSIAYRIKF